MTLETTFFVSLALWIAGGAVWLLPKKLKLMQRLGHLTADEIIQLGKAGDVEVQSLRNRGWWWFGIGLAVLLPQFVVLHVVKLAGG